VSDEVKEKVIIEPISLVGKCVKVGHPKWKPDDIRRKTEAPYLLQFFYPEFAIRDKIDYNQDSMIFTGNLAGIRYLKEKGYEYIATDGMFEIDLTDGLMLLEFVFSKHGKEVPKYLQDGWSLIEWDDLVKYCKEVWVCGVWLGPKDTDDKSIFAFYKDMFTSPAIRMKSYFAMCDAEVSPYIILNILLNASNWEGLTGKAQVRSKKVYEKTFLEGDNKPSVLKKSTAWVLGTKIDNPELKMFFYCEDSFFRQGSVE